MALTLAQIQALFPDNSTGLISAARIRSMVAELHGLAVAAQAAADAAATQQTTTQAATTQNATTLSGLSTTVAAHTSELQGRLSSTSLTTFVNGLITAAGGVGGGSALSDTDIAALVANASSSTRDAILALIAANTATAAQGARADTAVQPAALTTALATKADAATTLATVVVTTGSEARPTAPMVLWVGSTSQPEHMAVGDIWLSGATSTVAAPAFTTTTLNTLTVGTEFAQTLTVTGTTPITVALTGGSLPAGIAISGASLSGTPTSAGAYSFTVSATNSVGTVTQTYTGTVGTLATAPTITTTALSALTVGTAASTTIVTTGSTPVTFAVLSGALPAGLTLTGNVVSGTPTTAGAYTFTLRATNSAGTDDQAYSGTVASATVPVYSVMGTGTPGSGGTWKTEDSSVPITVANGYYTLDSAIKLTGLRWWLPATADLTRDVTISLRLVDFSGSLFDAATAFSTTPTFATTVTATSAAGWNSVNLTAPVILPAISNASGAADLAIVTVQYSGGDGYYVGDFGIPAASAVTSADAPHVKLADQTEARGFYNWSGSQANSTQFYGVDILFQDVTA